MKNLFKYASLLAAAVMLFSCQEKVEEDPTNEDGSKLTSLYILSDKDVIQSNGQDAATIKVYLNGVDVTAEAVLYNENSEVVELVDGKFVAEKDGEYKFWAQHGTNLTFTGKLQNAELFTIKAISKAIPSAVEDTDKSNTSFVHRAFLTQYTGTGCGYCPYMIKIIRELMADNTIPGKAVLAAVHSYSNSDPAYIAAPKVQNYPYMHINLETGFSHSQGSGPLYSQVNSIAADEAKAGISVNPVLYEDGTLVLKASVKAAVDGDFRIGAWLLEDGIYGQQADYDSVGDKTYSTHENCVRLIDSRYDGAWTGKHLGSIKAGETLDKTFVMNVKKAWKKENLHVAVIVSVKKGSKYVVCNAVDCPIDAPTPFDYK